MTCYLFFVFRFGDGEKPVFFFAAKDIRRGIPHRFFCTKTPGLLRLLLAVSKLQKTRTYRVKGNATSTAVDAGVLLKLALRGTQNRYFSYQ
jgi:hypothetical protein